MKQTFKHRPNLKITADFSQENPPLFRYQLSASKIGANVRPKTVCAIMQNPSYACEEFADKSVQVLERVIFEKNLNEFKDVERLIIVNQFGFIQTNNFVGTDAQIGELNEIAINNALKDADIILIAWGKDNKYMHLQKEILNMIRNSGEKILLQTSRHPSRVIYKGFIQKYYNI